MLDCHHLRGRKRRNHLQLLLLLKIKERKIKKNASTVMNPESGETAAEKSC
jgi:hypothetical protein